MQKKTSDRRASLKVGSDTIRCTQLWVNVKWHIHIANNPNVMFQNVWRVVKSVVMLRENVRLKRSQHMKWGHYDSHDPTLVEKFVHQQLPDSKPLSHHRHLQHRREQPKRLIEPLRTPAEHLSRPRPWCLPILKLDIDIISYTIIVATMNDLPPTYRTHNMRTQSHLRHEYYVQLLQTEQTKVRVLPKFRHK